ncbi:MAG: CHAD domain-containing protein [Candidatus Hydrogenedentota bacterium]
MASPGKFAARVAMAALLEQVHAICREVHRVSADDTDGVHDMRVASRRLRAVLTEFKPLFPAKPRKAIAGRGRHITQLLGRPRELDVDLKRIKALRGCLDPALQPACDRAAAAIAVRRREAAPACAEAARLAADSRLNKELARLSVGVRTDNPQFVKRAPARLARRFDLVTRHFDAWCDSQQSAQRHQVRIALKKLRYACEAFQPFYEAAMNDFIAGLKEVQGYLGTWNDARMLIQLIHELPADVLGLEARSALTGMIEADMDQHGAAFDEGARTLFAPDQRAQIHSFLRTACR